VSVVGPVSQGAQIPELIELVQWPSSASGRASNKLSELTGPMRWLTDVPGITSITVELTGKNDIFFANAAGAQRNHSYYLSLNKFSTIMY
jgi:hypothetical protein